ncbi:MAG: tetratricopeptide repeat protein [Phycisphaerae bacterium]
MFGRRRNTGSSDSYATGISLYRQGRYDQAVARLREASAGDDLCGRIAKFYQGLAHRQLGLAAMRLGEFDAAARHFHAAMSGAGRHAELAGYLAAVYARTGQYAQCVEQLETAADAREDSPAARRLMAMAQWQAGRREQAMMTLTAAMRKYPGQAELHLQKGLFHAAQEKFSAAIEELAAAVEADCTSPDAHYYLGLSYAAEGDSRNAVRSLGRAMQLRPDDLLLAWQLALAARSAADAGEKVVLALPEPTTVSLRGASERQLAQYLTAQSDIVDACFGLPPSEIDAEIFGLLDDVLAIAVADHSGYADLHFHRGRVLARLGRTGEAIDSLRRAVAINGRYMRALAELGGLLAATGADDAALECFEHAIAAGADWPDLHCRAGELMAKAGRAAQARGHLARALQLNANYGRAADAMRSLAA